VHDSSLGEEALERGCVDLVVAGHLHSQLGPERVEGPDGAVGYSYTGGTTGGAAYAVALGSKLRRDAQVSLITYREGHPVGIQAVDIFTYGRYQVQPYVELNPSEGTSEFQVPAPPLEGRNSPGSERDAAGR
jgi:hypothetical protein